MINSKTIKKQRRSKLIKKVGTASVEFTILVGILFTGLMALIII